MKRALAWFTRRLLRAAAAIGPEEKSEWIEAVLAEAESVEGPSEGLRWAWGAFFFACRCRILVALGIVQENIIMNRTSAAYVVIFLVVMGLLSAIPSFREAATVALGPTTMEIAFKGGSNVLSEGELQRMGAKGEQRGDTSTMAFVAVHLEDSEQAMRLGKKAIAMNPSLAWIEYFIIKKNWRTKTSRAAFEPKVHEVVAADPDNALGYLLLAEWLRRSDNKLAARRAEWEAAMEKAFSAPRYDDYLNRGLQLDREVIRDHGASPFVAAWSIASWAIPDLLEIKRHSDQLIASGDAQACARVARFGDMMQDGQSEIEMIIGQDIRGRALGVLEKKFELAMVAPKGPTVHVRGVELENLPFATANAIVVQVALLVGGLAALFVPASAAAMFLRRGKSAKLERLLRTAAITGVAAALVALLAYLPFAFAYRSYLQAQTAQEVFAKVTPFAGFGFLPNLLNGFLTTFQGHVYLWSLVILLACLGLLRRVVVHAQRVRTRPA
jgi:hypothetical protein